MRVYLDNSATTQLDSDALAEMMPYFTEKFGNPSSLHSYGREALKAVDEARAEEGKLEGEEELIKEAIDGAEVLHLGVRAED